MLSWRYRAFVVALALGGAAFPAAAAIAGRKARAPCGVRHGRVIAADRQALVVAGPQDQETHEFFLYGCTRSGRARAFLGGRLDFESFYRPPAVGLQGTTVGLAYDVDFNDTVLPQGYYVQAFSITRPLIYAQGNPLPKPQYSLMRASDGPVGSLRVTAAGALAWIECSTAGPGFGGPSPDCVRPGLMDTVELAVPPAVTPRQLDAGRQIDPRSLRLRGNTLSWIHSGRRRSVRLG